MKTVVKDLRNPCSQTFLSNNSLLVGVGDSGRYRDKAQELDSMPRSIAQVADDGDMPADNPFMARGRAAGNLELRPS